MTTFDFLFLDLLREIGALKRGHFLLTSGRHSDQYVEKFDLLRQPRATQAACGELIRRFGKAEAIDLVAGPSTGGIILAFEVARQLGLPAAYAERLAEGASARAFKRGTSISAGARVLVVDDIMTTGGSIRETLDALHRWDAEIAGIAVLVDRSGGTVSFEAPLTALATLIIDTWTPEDCPLCAEGAPLTKPGSSAPRGS
jgi:orotate phosphoribosyltransferase